MKVYKSKVYFGSLGTMVHIDYPKELLTKEMKDDINEATFNELQWMVENDMNSLMPSIYLGDPYSENIPVHSGSFVGTFDKSPYRLTNIPVGHYEVTMGISKDEYGDTMSYPIYTSIRKLKENLPDLRNRKNNISISEIKKLMNDNEYYVYGSKDKIPPVVSVFNSLGQISFTILSHKYRSTEITVPAIEGYGPSLEGEVLDYRESLVKLCRSSDFENHDHLVDFDSCVQLWYLAPVHTLSECYDYSDEDDDCMQSSLFLSPIIKTEL